jgi:hypothetical protein
MQVEITGLGTLTTPVRRRQMELGDWRLPRWSLHGGTLPI